MRPFLRPFVVAILCVAAFAGLAGASRSGAPEVLLDAVDTALLEIAENTDRASKKLRKSLLKARKALDRESPSWTTDGKNLSRALKSLKKVLDPDTDLGFAVEDARSAFFDGLLEEASTTFQMQQSMESGPKKDQAAVMQQNLDNLIFGAEEISDHVQAFKALSRAGVALDRFRAWLDAEGVLPPEPPAIPMEAKVNGENFAGSAVQVIHEVGSGRLYIRSVDASGSPLRSIIIEIPTGVTGTGTFDIPATKGRYEVGVPPATSTSTGGSVTITTLDTVEGIVRGTFHFDATGAAGAVSVTQGMFDSRDADIQ